MRDETPRYRPAVKDDAAFCGALDLDARSGGWLWGQREAEHAAQIEEAALDYVIAEDGDGRPSGYALLNGFRPGADIVELRRIVVAAPGRGVGRAFITALVDRAFDEFGAHRIWLDTFVHNERGRRLYESLGFVLEGVLREGFPFDKRFVSLCIYGLLAEEWRGVKDAAKSAA